MGGFESGPSFSPGEIRDAQNKCDADVGASQGEDDMFKDYFIGIYMDTDLDAPVALEEAEKLQQQEFDKLTSELNKSKASSARKEEDLSKLRASLKGVHQERTGFVEQDALVRQLREEVAAKDTEILELKRQNEIVTSERDLLHGELALTQDLLRSGQKEVTTLSAAKDGADEDASSYKRDATTANDRTREISEKAEQKLAQVVAYACLQARRQAFEEASAKGVDLSGEIRKVMTLEEESAPLTTSDEDSGSDSDGIGEFSKIRLCSLGEDKGSSASGPRNDNKRKESAKDEGAHSKASLAQRLKEDVSAELAELFSEDRGF
ncbi:uncharacterized protein [Nicotiana sylvestris]|uniref:uncharacterized protein n=1 Tax=Nicotiana sylvestris TaxID=4096 RepID=UPI00388CC20F